MLLQTNEHFRLLVSTQFCPLRSSPQRGGRAIGLLNLERLNRPILLRVVQNGPVRAKLAHLGTGADALLQPPALVQVRLIDQLERVDVGLEVLGEEVVIMMTNGIQQPIGCAITIES